VKAIGVIILSLILTPAHAFCSEATSSEAESSVLILKGEINRNLYEYYNAKISKNIKKIIVTSLGGDVKYGIYIGKDIYDRNLDVVVRDYCFSSCANYIFLAGRKKTIEKNSIIGFHGTSFSTGGGEDIEKTILNSKGNLIKIEDIMYYKNINRSNNELFENNIADMEFFYNIKASKNILFDFSGSIVIDETKYDPKPPYQDFMFWPSSKKLKKCYNIKNVDDRFRPKDEFRLTKDWQVSHPNARLWVGGDNMFDGCSKKSSKSQVPRPCETTTTHGIDDKGMPTKIETTVCR
jgi:hypothetical protein